MSLVGATRSQMPNRSIELGNFIQRARHIRAVVGFHFAHRARTGQRYR